MSFTPIDTASHTNHKRTSGSTSKADDIPAKQSGHDGGVRPTVQTSKIQRPSTTPEGTASKTSSAVRARRPMK